MQMDTLNGLCNQPAQPQQLSKAQGNHVQHLSCCRYTLCAQHGQLQPRQQLSCTHSQRAKTGFTAAQIRIAHLLHVAIADLSIAIALAVAIATAVAIAIAAAIGGATCCLRLADVRQQLTQGFQILHHQSCMTTAD